MLVLKSMTLSFSLPLPLLWLFHCFYLCNHLCHYYHEPHCCEICVITIFQVIKEENLQENAGIVGTYLMEKLLTLRDEFPDIVGDIRGKGLLMGIELISNKVQFVNVII